MELYKKRMLKALGLSAALHIAGAGIYGYAASPEEQPMQIELVYLDDNPEQEGNLQEEDNNKEIYAGYNNSMAGYKIGKENSDKKSNKDSFKDLEENLDQMDKDMKEISKSLKGILIGLKLNTEEINPVEAYHSLYANSSRNEVTYDEFFRRYCNAFLLLNDYIGRIEKKLEANYDKEKLVGITVRFEQNGRFRFIKVYPLKGVKYGKTIADHYKRVLRSINRNFVPLSEAGLKTPHYADYAISNKIRFYKHDAYSGKKNKKTNPTKKLHK